MSGFMNWLANMSHALATPDDTGVSPLANTLAGVTAAAGYPGAEQALNSQRQAQQAAKDYSLRQQQVQNQSILARQNSQREQQVADASSSSQSSD